MLLPRCSFVKTMKGDKELQTAGRAAVLAEIDAMAEQGLRCLGLAIKTKVWAWGVYGAGGRIGSFFVGRRLVVWVGWSGAVLFSAVLFFGSGRVRV
jgi:hypothetical protein